MQPEDLGLGQWFQFVGDAVVVADVPSGRIVLWNPAAEAMFGYTAQEALESTLDILVPDRMRAMHQSGMARFAQSGTGHLIEARDPFEMPAVCKDGTELTIEMSLGRVVAEVPGTFVLAIIRNITKRKQMEQTIRRMAFTDSLTGLPNRGLFHDRLTQVLAYARRHARQAAILVLDIDRFKLINESLGHECGDALLRMIAERLQRCLREGDTVSRLGGDEFTVVLGDLSDAQDAAKYARRILAILSDPFFVGAQELYLTASIGISLYPSDGHDAPTLTRNAEAALGRAKEHRNHFQLYAPVMNATAADQLAVENALRKAVDREEFRVYYQPKIDVQTRQITGAEALIRWQHPEWGLVPPMKFIPIAEKTGLIVPIGEWVLRSACEQAQAWRRAGHEHLGVSVNLSGRQLKQDGLVDRVSCILAETGLPAAWLELELTESILMESVETTMRTLGHLDAMGIHLSIDDFGTGYSSLSYLKRFPIDSLKIDRSFVQDIGTDKDDAAIASAVIAMAHRLQLTVVAEGVETAEQLEFLTAHACDEVQGYYFSRPVPADEFVELLHKSHQGAAFPPADKSRSLGA